MERAVYVELSYSDKPQHSRYFIMRSFTINTYKGSILMVLVPSLLVLCFRVDNKNSVIPECIWRQNSTLTGSTAFTCYNSFSNPFYLPHSENIPRQQ